MSKLLDRTKKPLENLRSALANSIVARQREADLILLGIVAREHVLLVGPPGCAKSMIAEAVATAVTGRAFVLPVMTTTTFDDIFGRIDLAKMQSTNQWSRLDGYLPGATVAVFDELWNGRGPAAHALLRALNERQWLDDQGRLLPLEYRLAVATSNLWPTPESHPDSQAAFDRFAIRASVKAIPASDRHALMFGNLPKVPAGLLCVADLDNAHREAMALPWSPAAENAIDEILAELNREGIQPSDRRLRKAANIAKAQAYLEGASDVQPVHLECLQYVLWDDPSQADKATEIVTRIANPTGAEIASILADAEQILPKLFGGQVDAEFFSSMTKLKDCIDRVQKLVPSGNGRAKKVVTYLAEQHKQVLLRATGLNS